MATRICGCSCKVYDLSYKLNLLGFTLSRSISPLKNFDELSELPVLSNNLTFISDALAMALSIAKYTEKDLQRIFKTVLKT